MNREFLINIVFLVLINLLIKPFYIFGIDRTVQNTLATGAYGLYFTLFNFTYLLQIINDFGIQNFNNRNIAQYRQLLDKYFPNILVLKGLLALIYFLVVWAFAWLAGYELSDFRILSLIAFNQVLASLVLFLRSNISGLGFYRVDSMISVLDKLIMIGLVGTLLWTPAWRSGFQLDWFVLAQTVSFGLTAIVAYTVVHRKLRAPRFRFQPRFLLLILRKSYPFALIIFLMTAYTRIDAVMIERMLVNGQVEADYYASAYRLLDASNMIGFMFAGLLLPMFARQLKEKEPVGQLVKFSFQFIWAGAVSFAIATFWYQEEIMVLLYKDGNAYSGQILGYLILSFLAISGGYIYGTLLTANGSLRKMNIIFACGVVLNVGLNLWLIPQQKALGAAQATCFTQFTVFIAQVFLSWKEVNLGFAPRVISRAIGIILLVTLVAFGVSQQLPFSWPVKYVLIILLGLAISVLIRLLNVKELWQLLRSK